MNYFNRSLYGVVGGEGDENCPSKQFSCYSSKTVDARFLGFVTFIFNLLYTIWDTFCSKGY